MRTNNLSLLTSSLLFCLAAGCAQTQNFEAIDQICFRDAETKQAMQAAEDILAQMNFTIEKADPSPLRYAEASAEKGFIQTRPLRAAQFFELWRSDNIGSFNTAQANIHTLRRIAQMNLIHNGEQLCIDCEVKTQRLSLPQRRTSAARAYGLFSKSDPSTQRLKLDAEQTKTMTWVDLGQDKMLSTAILKQLEDHLSASADKAEINEGRL
jgi:hypothetical protein